MPYREKRPPKYKKEYKDTLIRINKEEAEIIRNKLPETYITIVNKHSNHKHYWVPTDRRVLAVINKYRTKHNKVIAERW